MRGRSLLEQRKLSGKKLTMRDGNKTTAWSHIRLQTASADQTK
jgi:hypothetical protein